MTHPEASVSATIVCDTVEPVTLTPEDRQEPAARGSRSGADSDANSSGSESTADAPAREIGGQAGPEPTRYGDWEKNGRCTDF